MEVDSSQAATALITEHLQYTPLSLIDDITDSVNNFIYQGVGSLETGLTSTPPERLGFKKVQLLDGVEEADLDYPEAKQEIEEGLHKLETLLGSTVDKNFDKFEIYVLRNILAVPAGLNNWIRLKHYDSITYPAQDNAPTLERIERLRRKLLASRNVSRALMAEHSRNEAVLAQLRGMLGPKAEDDSQPNVSFLSSTARQQRFSGQDPLTTNTRFILSQLPALKTTLAELKIKLTTLQEVQLGMDTAKDEVREERRRYIEQRTKSHIERHGQMASVSSGPPSGKQTDTVEVEALEKAANIFNPP